MLHRSQVAVAVLLGGSAMKPIEAASGPRTHWAPVVEIMALIFPRTSMDQGDDMGMTWVVMGLMGFLLVPFSNSSL